MINCILENKPFIIAEVAQTHEGSLGNAFAFVDAVASAGANAIKFQTHIASAESTLDEPWRIKFSLQDESRYSYWKRMEFSEKQWSDLSRYAKERGIMFLSSPFSVEAVDMLNRIGIPLWKVPSGELSNVELIEAIWDTGRPILFSSGMSRIEELDVVVRQTRSKNIPFGIFQCTSAYPCSPKQWGLNMISELRARFKCLVGFSDHSGDIYAGLAAAALGADFIEVHVTFSRQMFGPDVLASVTIDELSKLVRGAQQIREALDFPVDKDKITDSLAPIKRIFGRSWALREDLPAGTVLSKEHLTLKKPGTGISYSRYKDIVGRKLCRDKTSKRLLTWNDIK